MTATHQQKVIAGALAAAVCFTVALMLAVIEPVGNTILPRVIIALGVLVIAVPTFEWGAVRGYRIQDETGRIHLDSVMRCLVMTAIVTLPCLLLGGVAFVAISSALK